MFDKLEVRTDQGALLTLSLQDVEEGYIISDIEGLDPVKATLVSSGFAKLDGEQFQSARREKRNIIISLDLEPDYSVGSVQALRNKLYQFFMPKSRVQLRFFSTVFPTVDIVGYIETMETPKFTKEPTATIGILCFDPDFYDPTPVEIVGSTTSSEVETTTDYPGTVETGITFELYVDRDIAEFTIFHSPADDSLRQLDFVTAAPLVAGDVLRITTSSGNKAAILIRGGIATSMLYAVSPQSYWINLFPGPNKLRVYAEGVPIAYSIEYTTKYGGL